MAINNLTESEKLFITRRRDDMTQKDMARRLGISTRRYINIEAGKEHLDGGLSVIPSVGELAEWEKAVLVRRRKGIRQEELAPILGISPAHLKAMERKKRNPAKLIDYWRARGEL